MIFGATNEKRHEKKNHMSQAVGHTCACPDDIWASEKCSKQTSNGGISTTEVSSTWVLVTIYLVTGWRVFSPIWKEIAKLIGFIFPKFEEKWRKK